MRKNSKTAAKHEMQKQLHQLYHKGRGNSKRQAKAKAEGVSPYIHSPVTLQTYSQQVGQYGDWLADNYPRCSLQEAAQHVQEYIDQGRAQGWSAWTQQTARSAIGKALGVKPTELARCDTRHAGNITRGRTETAKAAKAAAQYRDDMAVCECIGVRHGKEAHQVTPASCHWENGHISSISITGKGGRPREATVLPGRGRDILESRCKAAKAPDQKLMGKMTGCNVHGARAKYAAALYAKGVSEGRGNGQMYSPKGMPGQQYDKGVLDYVNENLGHGSGRYDTAVYNYLSYGGR